MGAVGQLLGLIGLRLPTADHPAGGLEHRPDQVDRHREHDGRVLISADLAQGLEIAELEGGRVAPDYVGRVGQPGGGLRLALGVDDLRSPLALGLGLAGDRVLHALGDLDVLDLDRGHLDAPWLGLGVDHLLQRLVQAFALAQQVVEVDAAEHRAQRRLGDLERRVVEVLDRVDRLFGSTRGNSRPR